ncbi:methyltransferase [Streptomyces iranensis]|uniref:8-O-methyltransferase n=1 Tax=Streptomyces iranensis TaxID=576784 RepID=A0A060ZSF9_9ACTN|nr:methyltransferase [Streptomyces iranensis]MBP2060860.1 8-O-methyltransferase [Streptomyces iranensis]CDR06321.1 O-methyltransferase family 2 [Streptomyces iranensis]
MEASDSVSSDLDFVMDIASGFWRSRALFSAVELGLFTELAQAPMTDEQITVKLGLHPRAAQDFLDALVALGLLSRTGDGQYANSVPAQRLLDRDQPGYVGGFLSFMGRALYPAWGRLSDLLRTGRLQEGDDTFGEFYKDHDRVRGFMAAMDSASAAVAARLVECVDWSRYRSVADLGGARGNLVARIVSTHPHLRGVCVDLPPLKAHFDEHMAALGTAGRVTFHAADFRTDPLPEADVMIFGHVLHDWDEPSRALLVGRVYEALAPGGDLLIYDELIDDDRSGPARSLLMSVNMKLVRSGGAEYTSADALSWLGAAGFQDIRTEPLTATERLITAHKK